MPIPHSLIPALQRLRGHAAQSAKGQTAPILGGCLVGNLEEYEWSTGWSLQRACSHLLNQSRRLVDERGQRVEELGAAGTIDDPVIE